MVPDPATQLVHREGERQQGAPSADPIIAAAWYTSAGDIDPGTYVYGRHGNPGWEALEGALGSLDDAECVLFASGLGASLALMLSLTEEPRRLLMPYDGYYGARELATKLRPHGVQLASVDLGELDAVEGELKQGRAVLWAETPTNPFLRVFDVAQLSRLAGHHGAPLVVDNTTATPVLQQPLDYGATACLYSLSKSVSGHSDVVLGAVTTRDEQLLNDLREWRALGGAIAGPFETWLALRGVKTLPLRITHQSQTAQCVAQWLAEQATVESVYYPGLDRDTRQLAERQMPNGYGPLLSFQVHGNACAADRVVAASRIIRPATSFGGLESTWERRARWASETAPENLIRLSIGLEAAQDLIADLTDALAVLQ
jgi:cystathionine beta-lyase/cystathionine gamma-synthase